MVNPVLASVVFVRVPDGMFLLKFSTPLMKQREPCTACTPMYRGTPAYAPSDTTTAFRKYVVTYLSDSLLPKLIGVVTSENPKPNTPPPVAQPVSSKDGAS